MAAFLGDARYGLRTLLKSPGFTAVAVLTLAIGIGANTAIFSVVNSILLRPLPYKDPDRLALIWENNLSQGWTRVGPSGPTFLDWKEQSGSFEEMAAFEPGSGTLTGLGEPEQIPGMRVSVNFPDLIGARPVLGRLFAPGEGGIGRSNVAVLTYPLWQRRFGSDPAVLGKQAVVDGMAYTVIGILSPDFWSPVPCEVLVAWDERDLRSRSRQAHDLGVMARLKQGVTIEQATAELNTIAGRIRRAHPGIEDWGVTVVPLHQALVEYLRPALLVLLGAVGFVLLVACANLANLLLARATARQKEVAIRVALGARRWRLIRQFLTESLLLAVLGGAVALLVAVWGVDVLAAIIPRGIPVPEASAQILLTKISIDARVLLFTLLISMASGLAFGLAPALQASKSDVSEALKEGGRTASSSGHNRLRSFLAGCEVALALVLLIGAGLMIRTFWSLQRINPGFNADRLLALDIELPTDTKYRQARERAAVFQRFLEKVEAVPGVRAAGLTRIVPLSQDDRKTTFQIEGHPVAGEGLPADYRPVSASYFHTLGVPLRKGRLLTDYDKEDAPPVAIIDETLARLFQNAGEDPVGRRLRVGSRNIAREIVGVVGDVRHSGLDKKPKPTIYVPFLQSPESRMSLLVRAAGSPQSLVPALKAAIWSVDKDQPVYNIRTMEQVIADSTSAPRLTLVLLLAFAAIALALAAFGIYGVISYSVSRRRHEMGVRMALGATSRDVVRLVLGEAMLLTIAGLAAGLAAAFALTRVLSSLLFGVRPTDAVTYVIVSLALGAVALAASYIPARRATRFEPYKTLGSE